MKTNVKDISKTEVDVIVTIPYNEFEPKLDVIYSKIAKSANIPGFRKGSIPKKIIDNYYSKDNIIAQAVQDNIQNYLSTSLKENNIEIIHPGTTTITQMPDVAKKTDLIVKANMEIIPKFNLPEIKNLTVTVDAIKVSDIELKEKIDLLRKQFSIMKPKENGSVENGNFVVMDFVVYNGDKKVEENNNVSFEVGSSEMLPGINKAIIGLKVGDKKEFETHLPTEKYAGKKLKAVVDIIKINEQELPILDDEFVKKASEFNSVGELKEDVKKSIENSKTITQINSAKNNLMQVFIKDIDIPVPVKFLDHRVEQLIKNPAQKDATVDKAKLKTEESGRIQEMFIAEKLIKKFKVNVSQKEILAYFEQMAQIYGVPAQQIMQNAYQSKMLNEIISGLTVNKALDIAIREVKIVDSNNKIITVPELVNLDKPDTESDTENKTQDKIKSKTKN